MEMQRDFVQEGLIFLADSSMFWKKQDKRKVGV
jgi:hypothetical protein